MEDSTARFQLSSFKFFLKTLLDILLPLRCSSSARSRSLIPFRVWVAPDVLSSLVPYEYVPRAGANFFQDPLTVSWAGEDALELHVGPISLFQQPR
jgi:hypothetical protein